MQFRLLGELEVLVDGSPVPVGAAKQRALLALLLLERGQAVSTDRLIDAIWSGRPPETAQKSIQVYVSGLRKELGQDRIVTRERGYELVVAPGETDVERFDELVRAGRFDDALQLVRGRPLADVALEPWAAPEVDRLEEKILAATEARIESDLERGQHKHLVPELESLVESHPYRERLLELLMLALYRSGRQAEALEAYRRGAKRLRDELGLEPGRSLQQLETAILQQDPALDPPAGARTLARRRRSWKLITAGAAGVLAAAAAATAIALTRGGSGSLESLPPGVAVLSASGRLARLPHLDDGDPAAGRGGDRKRPLLGLGPEPVPARRDRPERRPRAQARRLALRRRRRLVPAGRPLRLAHRRSRARSCRGRRRPSRRSLQVDERRTREYVLNWVTRCFGLALGHGQPGQPRPARRPGERPRDRADSRPVSGRDRVRRGRSLGELVGQGNPPDRPAHKPHRRHRVDAAPFVNVLAVGGGFAWTSNESGRHRLEGRSQREGRGDLRDRGRGSPDVVRGRTVMGRKPGRRIGDRHRRGDGRPGRPIPSGTRSRRSLRQGSRLLVEFNEGQTYEDRIAALKGKVAKLIVTDVRLRPGRAGTRLESVGIPGRASDLRQAARAEPTWNSATLRAGPRPVAAAGVERRADVHVLGPARPAASPRRRARIVTADDIRASIERAMSPKLGPAYAGRSTTGALFLDDIVGAKAVSEGRGRTSAGSPSTGLASRSRLASSPRRRSCSDSPCRSTARCRRTLRSFAALCRRSASERRPLLLRRGAEPANTTSSSATRTTTGRTRRSSTRSRSARGSRPEHAIARVESGAWDGAILDDELLAPTGAAAREAISQGLRAEDLRLTDPPFRGGGAVHALLSPRLGCDDVSGALDLAALCLRSG